MPTVSPRQETARLALILVLIFFLYISPDSSTSRTKASRDHSVVDNLTQSKNLLNTLSSARWQDFNPQNSLSQAGKSIKYLNLTGFRERDGYRGWNRFSVWKERCMLFQQQVYPGSQTEKSLQKSFYRNITGVVQGKWTRFEHDLTVLEGESWSKMNLSEIAPSARWEADNEFWARNITGLSGKIRFRLEESIRDEVDFEPVESSQLVREVKTTFTIHDDNSKGNGFVVRAHGAHWPNTGVLLMTTTSEKFAGIFGLPHLTHTLEQFTSSQTLLNKTLARAIQIAEKNSRTDDLNLWSTDPKDDTAITTPHCEFVLFAQIYPFEVEFNSHSQGSKSALTIESIEKELRVPIGAPIPKIPRLQMSTVILSPDCGFILESKGPPQFTPQEGEHLTGKKHEVRVKNMQRLLEIFAALILGQTILLKAQSKDASTPSTVGRVSLYTISTMLFADAFIFASLSLLSGISPNLFPSALLVSFMSLMSVMLGIRFLSAIWNSQEPERRERLRQQQLSEAASQPLSSELNTASEANITSVDSNINSNTTSRQPIDIPIIIPSDQDIDAEIFDNSLHHDSSLLPTNNSNGSANNTRSPLREVSFATMYIRLVIILTLVLFLTLTSTSWPTWLRTTYVYTLSFMYLSFPAFQIHRNIQRNCRKALLWKFVIGQSVLRLTPFVCFFLIEDNVFFYEIDIKIFLTLAVWLWIQCWILIAQNILGPRWGLPKAWYVEGWNYHPILRNENIEASGLPIGLSHTQELLPSTDFLNASGMPESTKQAGQKSNSKNIRSVDCAICMQILEVLILDVGRDTTSSNVAGILESRRYMVTPCRHIFHSSCLEGWMRFRLQCPICRENLPPL